ncbi:MAG: AMP-binding protein [Hellea sp.]
MSQELASHPTVIEKFYEWERTTPHKVFLRQPKGSAWNDYSYAEIGQMARKMVTALKETGLKPGDHIGIYSKNCYHWIVADLAIIMGGYVSVPLYASLPGTALAEVIDLGDLNAIFVGKLDAWDKAHEAAISEDLITIKFPDYDGNAPVTKGLEWDDLISKSVPMPDNFIPQLDDLWTIKFTSGTTGSPKGVMHSHRTAAAYMLKDQDTDWVGVFNIGELRYLSYLPLNHVGERMGVEMPAIWGNGTISFAENLATFAKNMQDTQPTVFFGVPRIWTNFYLGVINKMPEKKLDRLLSIPIVSSMVKKKLRTALGLRDVEVAATGAAITPAFIKKFYKKLGIHLIEAYGMTEVCGSMTNTPMLDAPLDSVGKAIPGGAVKIDPDSGEILMKSPFMMLGYYKNPEKTAEVIQDGWLRSGDRGTIDARGFVRVIGRVKDAFKTSKGSYITPNPLEEILAENDYVEQVCVVGLGIPQPIALFNLSAAGLKGERSDVEISITETMGALNATRAKFERISTAIIQSEAWSPENDCLTPTMKVKRFTLDDRFSPQYLNWHEAPFNVIWA